MVLLGATHHLLPLLMHALLYTLLCMRAVSACVQLSEGSDSMGLLLHDTLLWQQSRSSKLLVLPSWNCMHAAKPSQPAGTTETHRALYGPCCMLHKPCHGPSSGRQARGSLC